MLELNAKKLIEINHREMINWQNRSAETYENLKAEILPGLLNEVVRELEVKASKGQGVWVHKEVPEQLLFIKSDELSEFISVEDGYLTVMKDPNKYGFLKFELSESEFY